MVEKRFYLFQYMNLKSNLMLLRQGLISNNSYMKKYRCEVCDWIYDPEVGDPENGIAPGTAFEDIPDDWRCPVCGVGKEDFVVEE